MSRGLWFLVGAGAGVYAVQRARRAAEALTPEGVEDRWHGLSLGAHLFREEVRDHMSAKESELRDRLGLRLDESRALSSAAHEPAERTRPRELTREGAY